VGLDRQCRGLGGLDVPGESVKNSYGGEDTDGAYNWPGISADPSIHNRTRTAECL
jgi:hypothetical protein